MPGKEAVVVVHIKRGSPVRSKTFTEATECDEAVMMLWKVQFRGRTSLGKAVEGT